MDALERLRRGYATFNARERYDPDDFTADFVLEQTPTIFDSAGRFEGVDETVRPGALGAYVFAFEGIRDGGTVTLTASGKRITRRLGR